MRFDIYDDRGNLVAMRVCLEVAAARLQRTQAEMVHSHHGDFRIGIGCAFGIKAIVSPAIPDPTPKWIF